MSGAPDRIAGRLRQVSAEDTAEVDALFRDLLIGVTSFFRDPDAFQVLEEQIIPQIFANKPPGDVIRVWSTGMLDGRGSLFARHPAAGADGSARAGQVRCSSLLPTSTAGRLRPRAPAVIRPASPPTSRRSGWRASSPRADGSAYRINKSVRDLLIFSEHDVCSGSAVLPTGPDQLPQPADLFGRGLAEKHHSAVPLRAQSRRHVLFLGTSESIGSYFDLFAVVDRKAKLYQRKEDFAGAARPGLRRFLSSDDRHATRALHGGLSHEGAAARGGRTSHSAARRADLRWSTGRATSSMCTAAAALTSSRSPGEAGVNNVIKMARQGLQHELSKGLHQASCSKAAVVPRGCSVRTNGDFCVST
jgi:two-component system CheB/CheR fusion protein